MAQHVVILMTIFLALNFTHILGRLISHRSYETGRVLAESNNVSESSRRLDRSTVRVDPLNNLKKYRGGYDIRNKHYWSSTAYTGVHGYVIAVIWLIFGVIFVVVTTTCRKQRDRKMKKKRKRSLCVKECFLQPISLLAILFTLLAVIACGLILGGDTEFHSTTKKVTDIIINAAENASHTIYNTTGAMKEMKRYLTKVDGSSKAIDFLNSTSQRLDSQADEIQRQAYKNKGLIDQALNLAYIITTVTISSTLVIVIALLVLKVLEFHKTLQVLIVICWIFTVLSWFFFGVYFFLQNFAGDTCTAIESFQMDPYNNSFSSILPCDELLSAKSVLTDVSAGVYNLVNKVNANISTSYGNILQICNPFSSPPKHEYEPWNCPNTSTQIGDVPQVLRELACPDSIGETCKGGILIPSNYYDTVEAYCSSIQKLLDAYPGMENLVQCRTVKDAFSKILCEHCKPLKRYVRIVWIGLVFLSSVQVVLILIWIIETRHEQNHQSLSGSLNTRHSDEMESGTKKTTTNNGLETGQDQ